MKKYKITQGGYTPLGRWQDDLDLMDYRHAVNAIAKKFREANEEEFAYLMRTTVTVWGCGLEIVNIRTGRVTYDADLEPVEGKYIAAAAQRAINARRGGNQ